MEGTVYVLTNPAMEGLVKIGKTTRDVSLRLADLYTTGVPLPFECKYAAKVRDVDETEKAFHEAFGPNRINIKREFFEIKPLKAIAALKLMAIEYITPTVQEESNTVYWGLYLLSITRGKEGQLLSKLANAPLMPNLLEANSE